MGNTVGYLLGPWMVLKGSDMRRFLLVEVVIASVPFAMALVHFPDRPKLPPSPAAVAIMELEQAAAEEKARRHKEEQGIGRSRSTWADVQKDVQKELVGFRRRSFWLVVGSAGLLAGVNCGWSTVLQSILDPLGFNDKQVGWIGFGNSLAQGVGALMGGKACDWLNERDLQRRQQQEQQEDEQQEDEQQEQRRGGQGRVDEFEGGSSKQPLLREGGGDERDNERDNERSVERSVSSSTGTAYIFRLGIMIGLVLLLMGVIMFVLLTPSSLFATPPIDTGDATRHSSASTIAPPSALTFNLLAATAAWIGFSQGAVMPLYYELLADITAPTPEGHSAGMLVFIWNAGAFGMYFIAPHLRSSLSVIFLFSSGVCILLVWASRPPRQGRGGTGVR
jgi:MFS family permease